MYIPVHFYDYTVDQWNASSFKIPRMASEYGVQAWCNNESLANVFAPEDFSRTSAMVNHRQHHRAGEWLGDCIDYSNFLILMIY